MAKKSKKKEKSAVQEANEVKQEQKNNEGVAVTEKKVEEKENKNTDNNKEKKEAEVKENSKKENTKSEEPSKSKKNNTKKESKVKNKTEKPEVKNETESKIDTQKEEAKDVVEEKKDKKEIIEKAETTDSNKENSEKSEKKHSEKDIKKSKKNEKEVKNDKNTSENKKEENDKPDYVVDESKKKKRTWKLLIFIIFLMLLVLLFSTIFAFLNINSNKIAKGISIKEIDLSNLTVEEAKDKLTQALSIELNIALNLKYQDFETTFDTNQIEYAYKINEAVENAYGVGRNKSIIENNYDLLGANIFGKSIDIESSYNEESLNYIIKDIGTKIPGLVEEPSYYREGKELIIEKGTDGVVVDSEKLKSDILNDIDSRNANEIQTDTNARSLEIPVIEQKASKIDVEKIYSEVHTEPKDAYYEENPFKIYKEEEGVDFGISIEEAKNIIGDGNDEEYKIPLKLTPASKTINDIGKEAFPYQISTFPTRYDATNLNRTQNLRLATNKINGTVLMPGETFSFNQVVGKRTIDAGYKDAKIYENGKVVDGLAGGICQVSSTLYNAVLLANLEIVERTNHSFTTSYVKAGRDATVVYGVKDFQFKNNRNYPIKIEGTVASGIITFTIHGIKEETEYEVKIVPYTTGTIPYSTQTIVDSSLAPGTQVIEQSGHAGCKVTTYKQLWLNGTMVSNELLSNDTYNPMQTIIRVGE